MRVIRQTEGPAQDERRVSCAACVGTKLQVNKWVPEALIYHHMSAHAEVRCFYVLPENICKDSLGQSDEKEEESNANLNIRRLKQKRRHTREISMGCVDQETCKHNPQMEHAMLHGMDINYFECLTCSQHFETPRKAAPTVYRFANHQDLVAHIALNHPDALKNSDNIAYGATKRSSRWEGFGAKNALVLDSGPFNYAAPTAYDEKDDDSQRKQAMVDIKKRQNSFRMSNMDLNAFVAGNPDLEAIAESAADVVQRAFVQDHGGGKQGARVWVCMWTNISIATCV